MIPPPLPDELYALLGKVSVYFSALETTTRLMIWALLRVDQFTADIVTAKLPFRSQLDVLSALFRHRYQDEALRSELANLVARADSAEQRRNAIVHSMWVIDSLGVPGRVKTKASRKKGHELDTEWFRPGELEAVIKEIGAASTGLWKFYTRVIDTRVAGTP